MVHLAAVTMVVKTVSDTLRSVYTCNIAELRLQSPRRCMLSIVLLKCFMFIIGGVHTFLFFSVIFEVCTVAT